MALRLSPVYSAVAKRFRQPESSERFLEDFVYCVNLIYDELSFIGDLATAIGHITAVNDETDELDPEHTYIVDAGLDYLLTRQGYKPAAGDVTSLADSKASWEVARDSYLTMLRREDQDTVDDDGIPSDDIVGLGYKED